MQNILMEQHVSRRRLSSRTKIKVSLLKKTSPLTRAAVSQYSLPGAVVHSYNTDVIRQIKQKPAHIHKGHAGKQAAPRFFTALHIPGAFRGGNFSALFRKGLIKIPKRGSPDKSYARVFNFSAENSGPASSGKSSRLRGFPLGPVVVAFVVLVFSLIILNWESPSLTLLLEGPAALEIHDDGEAMRNLAAYAGLSPAAAPAPAEEIPLDLAEAFSWESYQVKRGDSVSKIAAAHAISVDAIIASNGISNARRLQAGETLRIPNMDGIPYTVKNGDSLLKISIAMGVPLEAILDANDIQSDIIGQGTLLFIPGARMKKEDLKLALGELFVYPVRGRLTSAFGWRNDPISGVRRHHAALDLAAGMGTPVKASMDGTVSTVGLNSVYGKYIIISHGNAFQTMYAHLSQTSVKKGARVTQGSKIGEVGSTGYSTGPHLHFAVYKNGRAVNPLEFLNQ